MIPQPINFFCNFEDLKSWAMYGDVFFERDAKYRNTH